MMKIKTLIVDDEPLARKAIRLMLKHDAEIEIVGECDNGQSAVELIHTHKPDLVFLDIQMPEMNGFEVLETVGARKMPAVVIFVTAYDEYAIHAFEVNALDYLLKPFSDERFEKALQRAKSQLAQREINDLSQKLIALVGDYKEEPPPNKQVSKSDYTSRFMIKSGGRISFVKVDEIDWIEAADYYVKLHTGRKSHLIRETMNVLEKKLDPRAFIRIHRSTIVNIERIKELQPHFNGDYIVLLNDGTELKLSRTRREQLHALLNK
jgi:two-component system, LytTR family, response regulator